jgi:type II secretory pathway component PulF
MSLLALSSAAETAWWVTLGVGLVVALVVWALLEALRRTVNEVDEAVERVWTMGKRVAQNTQTTHMLMSTRGIGIELRDEVERHRALAGRSEV